MPDALVAGDILDLEEACRKPIADQLERRIGRPIRGHPLSSNTITQVRSPGWRKLRTTGPIQIRRVVLQDDRTPHPTMGVQTAIIVPGRLPVPVQTALNHGAEPVDRVLTFRELPWTAELHEVELGSASDCSVAFAWAAADTPSLELTRLIHIAGEPVAILLDEVLRLPPVPDALSPLAT